MPEVQNVGATDYAQYQPSQYQNNESAENYNVQPEVYDENMAEIKAANKSRLGATIMSAVIVAGIGVGGYLIGKHSKVSGKDIEKVQDDAKKYAKCVVMTDKDNLRAYLIVLMAEGKVKEVSDLSDIDNPACFRRAYELADEDLKKLLEARKYDFHKDIIYRRAVKVIKNSKDINNYKKSLAELKTINGYHDSNELIKQCEAFIEKYEQERYEEKKKQYDEAVELYKKAIEINPSEANAYILAGNLYSNLKNFEEAEKMVEEK